MPQRPEPDAGVSGAGPTTGPTTGPASAPAAPADAVHATTPVGQAAPTGRLNGKREVLVVEDDPEINELVGAYARLAGFEYRSALDGTTALAEVRRHTPSVIVLDLMLPDFDGFEVCRRVKREPGMGDVPVIILTALDNEISRRQGREAGAADYLTKPFDPDRLMATISHHAGRGG
jgi:CheY-like chemotaxis protein